MTRKSFLRVFCWFNSHVIGNTTEKNTANSIVGNNIYGSSDFIDEWNKSLGKLFSTQTISISAEVKMISRHQRGRLQDPLMSSAFGRHDRRPVPINKTLAFRKIS